MPFDLPAARSAGYSDREILEGLAAERKFDLPGALAAGYSEADILAGLTAGPAPGAQGGAQGGPQFSPSGDRGEVAVEFLPAGDDAPTTAPAGPAAAPRPARPARAPLPLAQEDQPTPDPDQRSLGQRAAAVPGRVARSAIEAVGAGLTLPHTAGALVLNAPAHLWNLGAGAAELLGADDHSVTPPFEYGAPARAAEQLADGLGLPKPQGTIERIGDRMGTELLSGAGLMGAGRAAGAGLEAAGRWAAPRITRGLEGTFLSGGRRLAEPSTARRVADAFADAPVSQATGAAGSGLLGGAAAELTDNAPAQFVASLAGSVLGGAAPHLPAAARTAERVAGALRAPLDPAGRDKIVGSFFRQSATDPEAAIARLEAGLEPLVPGSTPTPAEVSRDPGLLQTERGLRNTGAAGQNPFGPLETARTAARRAEVEAVAPAEGQDASTVADAVDARLAREREALAQTEEVAGRQVAAADAALPPSTPPEAAGAVIGEQQAEAHTAAREATSRAYGDIDPEGTSAIPLAPIRAAAEDAVSLFYGTRLGTPAPRVLDDILRRLTEFGGGEHATAPWREIQGLREAVGAEAEAAGAQPGGAKLQRALLSILDAIDETGRRASEPYVPEGRPLTEADIMRGHAEEAAGQHPDLARALDSAPGAASQSQVRAARRAEKSLVQMLVESGGINISQDRGDLASILGTTRARPGLVNNEARRAIRDPNSDRVAYVGGRSPEDALTAAIEDGYFDDASFGPSGPSVNDLYAAIADELAGKPPRHALGASPLRDQIAGQDGAHADLEAEVGRRGGALGADTEETLRSIRQPVEGPGMDAPGADPLIAPGPEAFTPEQAVAYRAAQDKRIEQSANHETGAAAQAARSPDSGKAQAFFHQGVGGPEAAAQFVAGLGDRPQAVAALESYAATDLRRYAANRDGSPGLDAGRVARWIQDHRGALSAFPDLAERFRTVAGATAEAERLVGLRQASVAEIEAGVAQHFLKGAVPQVVMANILRSNSVTHGMQGLMALVGQDAAAVRGMRRAYVEALLDRATTTGHLPDAAGEAVDGLSSHAFQRQLQQTRGAAQILFDRPALQRLDNVARDFRNGTMWQRANGVAGSNTGQNLSMAYLLGQASQGRLSPQGMPAGVLNNTLGRAYAWALKQQAPVIERLVMEAAAGDPKELARLMRGAKPGDGDALLRWGSTHGSPSLREAIAPSFVRASGRASTGAAVSQQAPEEERPFADGGSVTDEPRRRGLLRPRALQTADTTRYAPRIEAVDAMGIGRPVAGLPPAANSRLTQIATTGPTYEKAGAILRERGVSGPILDYGAGRGHGSAKLGADSFEPYPGAGFSPTYTDPDAIPSDHYGGLVNLNVLNVLHPEHRQAAVGTMGRVLAPGGQGVITTRGRDVMAARGTPGPEDMSLVIGEGDAARYQKGFTQRELSEYLGQTLGAGYDVEGLDLGAAGAVIRRRYAGGGSILDSDDPVENVRQRLPERPTRGDGASMRAAVPDENFDPVVRRLGGFRTQSEDDAIQASAMTVATGMGDGGNPMVGGLGGVIRAYHGSPHRFGRFDVSKIGTGEGNQSYGRGLYFAENEGVARHYRDALTDNSEALSAINQRIAAARRRPDWRPGELAEWLNTGNGLKHSGAHRLVQDPDAMQTIERLVREPQPSTRGGDSGEAVRLYRDLDDHARRLWPQGSMYEVELQVDPRRLLDWDKEVRHQPEGVHQGMAAIEQQTGRPLSGLARNSTGADIYHSVGLRMLDRDPTLGINGAAAHALRDAEVPGVRYLDQHSRHTGDGSSNYVTFDDKPVKILRRYADGGEIGGLGDPAPHVPSPGPSMVPQASPAMSATATRGAAEAAHFYRVAAGLIGG